MLIDEEEEEYVVKMIKSKYFQYKVILHDKYEDYIDCKGFWQKPTGIVIKKENMEWKEARINFSVEASHLFSNHVYERKVFHDIYVHFDEINKIILYRF